ncbi:MAG: hypothetical protein ACOCV8_05060, partial [Spirochaetota bacterium]
MAKDSSTKKSVPEIFSQFVLNPKIKPGDIIKLGKIEIRDYDSISSAVASEIPVFLRWIEQIQSIILEQKVVTDRKIMLEVDNESQEKLCTILISIIRQFSPDILYLGVIYYPDELPDDTHRYQLVEHKIFEDKGELRVTRISRFNPAIYNKKNPKEEDEDPDIKKKNILQHIAAKNIYTPLIIEKNNKGEKILNKVFLDYKGKGELFNYDKKLIARYPHGTIIYPFAITNRVKFIFEIKFNEKKEKIMTSLFVIQFLKHLRKTVDRIIRQAYTIRTCKGYELLKQLTERKSLDDTIHKKKAVIFMDIYEYSKLSILIKDKDKSYQENEEIKYRFVNIFNLVVSEIINKYENTRIDKIVGDMHMIEIDADEVVKTSSNKEEAGENEIDKRLMEKAFMISWNINLVLRSLNKKAREIFEERNIDILDSDTYHKLMNANRNKSLRLELLAYPKPTKNSDRKFIYLGMDQFVYYHYICKKFKIPGLRVRIG